MSFQFNHIETYLFSEFSIHILYIDIFFTVTKCTTIINQMKKY